MGVNIGLWLRFGCLFTVKIGTKGASLNEVPSLVHITDWQYYGYSTNPPPNVPPPEIRD